MAFRNEEYRHNFGQINCLDQMITPLFDYPPKISGKARALIDLADTKFSMPLQVQFL